MEEPSISSTFFSLINNLNDVKNHFKNIFNPLGLEIHSQINNQLFWNNPIINNGICEMNKMFSTIKDTYNNTVSLVDKISKRMDLKENEEENVMQDIFPWNPISFADIIFSCSILLVLYCLKKNSINNEQNKKCSNGIRFSETEWCLPRQQSETGMSCSICFEEFTKIKKDLDLPYKYLIHKTICNHSFCIHCINKWLENKNSCPLCRTIIK